MERNSIMIYFDKEQQVFHLSNKKISYLIAIEENNYLSHLYFGKKINQYSGNHRYPRIDRSFSPNPPNSIDRNLSLDTLLMEFPGNGFGDFREPAYNIKLTNGSRVVDFRYKDYRISTEKERLSGLPATYTTNEGEAETLTLVLEDKVSQLNLEISYSIFSYLNVITRSAKLINFGAQKVEINRLASLSLDFPATNFDLLHLNGTWARERYLTRESVNTGIKVLDSKRGSSSHQQNPFAVLAEPSTSENYGIAYGFSLIYSGNHETVIQKDPYDQARLIMGINSYNFSWQLEAGKSFQTPEAAMVFSEDGLNGMSQTFHELFNHHLTRGQFKQNERPVLINNWEATYFDFDEPKIMKIVDEAANLGIEMFVLDDGWFGNRENDQSSLGDWFEHPTKLVSGLKGLSQKVHQKGMKFGIWFEPEMISEASELYKVHPDWAFAVPSREKSLGRSQYVLDFSRKDVRENLYEQMKKVLDNATIDYIKWDMNRNMTEVYSKLLPADQQGEVAHRYILGLYEFLEKLTKEYPNILFESCSGGGGRFDPGMLYYMPQTWTSDNTDAIARLKIQYGTSLVYPISSMGSHVSAIPNHQTGRKTSLKLRGDVAMSGIFGYELDLTALEMSEKNEIKEQVTFYKKHRRLLQYGKFIRLKSPFEENETVWMLVSGDRTEALLFYFRVLAEASNPITTLKLTGLSEDICYRIGEKNYFGDELMNLGLPINPELQGDYMSEVFYLEGRK